jgi:hypothetical protein
LVGRLRGELALLFASAAHKLALHPTQTMRRIHQRVAGQAEQQFLEAHWSLLQSTVHKTIDNHSKVNFHQGTSPSTSAEQLC